MFENFWQFNVSSAKKNTLIPISLKPIGKECRIYYKCTRYHTECSMLLTRNENYNEIDYFEAFSINPSQLL